MAKLASAEVFRGPSDTDRLVLSLHMATNWPQGPHSGFSGFVSCDHQKAYILRIILLEHDHVICFKSDPWASQAPSFCSLHSLHVKLAPALLASALRGSAPAVPHPSSDNKPTISCTENHFPHSLH